jgi:predicted O-methyltransferase YrrM
MVINEHWCPQGHFNLDQKEKIEQLVSKVDPKYALEYGFCTGRSAYTVLNAAKNLKKMVSIDIDLKYMSEGLEMADLLQKDFKNYTVIESPSKEYYSKLSEIFPKGIDWATIDGDHTYKGMLLDISSVIPHMNIDGVIAINSYMSGPPNAGSFPEVTRAVREIVADNDLVMDRWYKDGKGVALYVFNRN